MDAFLGSWQSGPSDIQGLDEYVAALGQPDLAKAMGQGIQATVSKDGDSYVFVNKAGGVETAKEVLQAGGNIAFTSATIPADLVKLTWKLEGGKIVVDGTYAGTVSKSVRYMDGGKLHVEITVKGATLKARLSKV